MLWFFYLFRENGELFCDFKFSSFACTKRRQPQTDAEEKALAISLKRALQPLVCRHEFPNFQVPEIYASKLQPNLINMHILVGGHLCQCN